MGFAQNVADLGSIGEELPNAPGRGSGSYHQQTSQQPAVAGEHASISGTVDDMNGTVVPAAKVTLADADGTVKRTTVSDSEGRFSFADLPAGSFRLTVESDGLATFNSDPIVLAAGEAREMKPTGLRIASANTEVQVYSSTVEIATEQVHMAEKQRVLGIIPNFYSSYIWDAAPLTTKLKFNLAVHSTTDPVAFMLAAGVAGVEQSHNTFPGYGRGPEGYAKRYGAAYADNVIGRFIGSAVLPSVFHQDPRYFYKGKGSVASRALYAIESTVVTRGDNGRSQPNYSHVLGNFAAAGISNLYRSAEDRKASLTLRNGLIITGTNAIGNLVREFLLKGMTPKLPATATGQP